MRLGARRGVGTTGKPRRELSSGIISLIHDSGNHEIHNSVGKSNNQQTGHHVTDSFPELFNLGELVYKQPIKGCL
jgi:hypothetical protein